MIVTATHFTVITILFQVLSTLLVPLMSITTQLPPNPHIILVTHVTNPSTITSRELALRLRPRFSLFLDNPMSGRQLDVHTTVTTSGVSPDIAIDQ